MTHNKMTKHVTFKKPINAIPLHPASKPIQSTKQQIQPKPTLKVTPLQDHNGIPSTTEAAHNIVLLIRAFPISFDAISNIPGTYPLNTDPNIHPVQHARCKVPTKCREWIEKTPQEMVVLQVISSCHTAKRMDLFPHLSLQAQWHPSFLPGPSWLKQSYHLWTLQSSHARLDLKLTQ